MRLRLRRGHWIVGTLCGPPLHATSALLGDSFPVHAILPYGRCASTISYSPTLAPPARLSAPFPPSREFPNTKLLRPAAFACRLRTTDPLAWRTRTPSTAHPGNPDGMVDRLKPNLLFRFY